MAEEQQQPKAKTAVQLYQEEVRETAKVVRRNLEGLREQFQMALPAHIPVERFERVVMTSVQNSPALIMECTRESLFSACVKAAQDGLLPDGREGAIVPMGKVATWLPMIAGIRKKARNSGEIIDWDVQLVYSNDLFEYELGTSKFVRHKPFFGNGDTRGVLLGGYSIANLKDGGLSIELMRLDEIEAIRKKASRAKSADSPWNVAEYHPEMCRKTIARRHSKALPMSSDLDDLIRRDDHLYDQDKDEAPPQRRHKLGSALDALAGPTQGGGDGQQNGQATEANDDAGNGDGDKAAESSNGNGAAASNEGGSTPDANAGDAQSKPQADPKPDQKETQSENPGAGASADGGAKGAGKSDASAKSNKPAANSDKPKQQKAPTTEREYEPYAKAWIDAIVAEGKAPSMLKERWGSEAERKLRNASNVSPEKREEIFEYLVAAEQKAGGG